jgi:outer membrane protein TolC
VIAVGLIVSMVFTLVVVPVLYVVVERRVAKRAARRATSATGEMAAAGLSWATSARATLGILVALIAFGSAGRLAAQSAQRVTLDEAIGLAQRQGTLSRLAAARVVGAEAHRRTARADYLPTLGVTGNRIQGTQQTTVTMPRGLLGSDGAGAPVPFHDGRFEQGVLGVSYAQVTLAQPLTQLYRIRRGDEAASAALRGVEADSARTSLDVALNVERLYLGTLIARERLRAAEASLAARKRQAVDARSSAAAGMTVDARAEEAHADALEAEYAAVAARNQAADLEADLRDMLGVPERTALELVDPPAAMDTLASLDEYVARARAAHPDVLAARASLDAAHAAEGVARAAYIPDIGVGVSYLVVNGLSFVPKHSATVNVQASWTAWDFGKRSATVQEQQANVRAAEIAAQRARDRVVIDVEKAYRRAERAKLAARAARAACDARTEGLRVAGDQTRAGIALESYRVDAEAAHAHALAEAMAAELDARIAVAELEHAAGTPRRG